MTPNEAVDVVREYVDVLVPSGRVTPADRRRYREAVTILLGTPSVDDVVAEARAELVRATAKHPSWPTDPFHALAIIGEEFGELQQTFLKSTYEGGKAPDKAEAVQLAAMALRFLQHWDDYATTKGGEG